MAQGTVIFPLPVPPRARAFRCNPSQAPLLSSPDGLATLRPPPCPVLVRLSATIAIAGCRRSRRNTPRDRKPTIKHPAPPSTGKFHLHIQPDHPPGGKPAIKSPTTGQNTPPGANLPSSPKKLSKTHWIFSRPLPPKTISRKPTKTNSRNSLSPNCLRNHCITPQKTSKIPQKPLDFFPHCCIIKAKSIVSILRHKPAQAGTSRHKPAQAGTSRHKPAQAGTRVRPIAGLRNKL